MTVLIESSLLGIVTVMIFLYGVAQRHLKNKLIAALSLERTKSENALARHVEHLSSLKIDIAKSREDLEEIQKLKHESAIELADLKDQKQKIQEYLTTEDGKATKQALMNDIEKVQAELHALIKKRDEVNVFKQGTVLTSVPFSKGAKIWDTLQAHVPELDRFSRLAPGATFTIEAVDGVWMGSSVASFKTYIDGYKGWIWCSNGKSNLAVG
jgi:hypothetical protein